MLIGSTLWAFSHALPESDGLMGSSERAGYFHLLDILARPTLMIFGFFLTILLINGLFGFVGTGLKILFASEMQGTVAGLPSAVARTTIVPALPEFMAEHPGLELEVSSTDRQVDLVQEGFDCVLRLGPVGDETLIARPLGLLRMVNAASPAYLARYSTTLGARPYGWEYPDGHGYATLHVPGTLHVNSAQTYEAAALSGLGLIQAPLLGIGPYLKSGALVEILPDFRRRPLAVSLVVAHRGNLSRRVRAFMQWIEGVVAPHLE